MEKEHKGRLSFVDMRRKSLTFSNIFQNQKEPSVSESKQSIKAYLDSLEKEKCEWKEILKNRKILWKTSEENIKFKPYVIVKKDIEKFMPNDYRDFLEKKPNYLEMVQSVKKYFDTIHYFNKYKSDIIDCYNKVCDEIEMNQKVLVNAMCDDNLCDICNTKNCQISEHKFCI